MSVEQEIKKYGLTLKVTDEESFVTVAKYIRKNRRFVKRTWVTVCLLLGI